jgi:hypothetical protein
MKNKPVILVFKIIERLSALKKNKGVVAGNGRTAGNRRQQINMVRTFIGFPSRINYKTISCGIVVNEV